MNEKIIANRGKKIPIIGTKIAGKYGLIITLHLKEINLIIMYIIE
jgi:hypothetical protein